MAIRNNKKNFTEKVKVGEFKNPAEIIRDLINSGAVQELKKGGYLKNKNTYVTEDGRETRRGLWANVHLKNKREGKKEDGGILDNIANYLGQKVYGDSYDPNAMAKADKAYNQSVTNYKKALVNKGNSAINYMQQYPNTEFAKELRQEYTPTQQSPVDTNSNYAPKLQMEKGGGLNFLQKFAPALNLITPGLGTAIGGVAGVAKMGMNQEGNTDIYTMNQQMKDGGEVSGFKQYNAPSHEMGGQMVNKEGVPDTQNPVAEIEGTENSYKYSTLPDKVGTNYVFSDANQTSNMVKDIISKYKNKNPDTDLTSKAAMEMEIKGVEDINETINAAKNAVSNMVQMRYGGKTKYAPGGSLSGGMPPQDPLTGPMSGYENIQEVPTFKPLDFSLSDNPYNRIEMFRPIPELFTRGNDQVESMSASTNTMPEMNLSNIPSPNVNVNPANTPNTDKSGIGLDQILRTAGLVASGIDALQPAEEDRLITPDYSKSDERINAMNATLDQARQDVTGASNRASDLNRGASSSYSQFRARELSNIGNLQDQLGRIGMQEQQMRNQILGQQGQYEANKANVVRNIEQEQQVANLQNKARSQDIRRQFMADVVAEADRLSTAKDVRNITAAKIEEGKALLNMIAPDFDVNNDMVSNLIKVSKGQMRPEDLSDQELIVFTRLNDK
jgi:hypothetical protein